MKNIKTVIEGYLCKQTQYAIQLVGKWGIGKTHFYKHVLKPKISTIPTYDDHSRMYKPVYISLFGVKSIERLQMEILNELIYSHLIKRKLSKNILRISSKLFKLLVSGYLAFKGLENAKDYVTEVTDLVKDIVKPTDLFICFDDLERMSPTLAIEEFTGYVNMLVDSEAKVMIICNEETITDVAYKNYKEKVVGITLDYNPKPNEIINQIVASRYAGSTIYSSFLEEIMPAVVDLASKNNFNYRTLLYGLDALHDIHSILRKNILDTSTDYSPKLKKEMPAIANYSLSCAMEFKQSTVSYAHSEIMKRPNWLTTQMIKNIISEKSEKALDKTDPMDISRIFIRKYYHNPANYKYYDSIFGYVTGAKEFDIELFVNEFKEHYHLEKGIVTPEYQVLASMEDLYAMDLEEAMYKESTFKMIEFARAHKYHLFEYLKVYDLAKQFDNILDIDLESLKEELKLCMTHIVQNPERMKKENIGTAQWIRPEMDTNLEDMRIHGLELIKSYKEQKGKQEKATFTITLENNLDEFNHRYHTDESFREFISNNPVFAELDEEKFLQQLIKVKPSSINMLRSILRDRYTENSFFEKERGIIELMINHLKRFIDTQKEKTIKLSVVKDFHTFLIELQHRNFSTETGLINS